MSQQDNLITDLLKFEPILTDAPSVVDGRDCTIDIYQTGSTFPDYEFRATSKEELGDLGDYGKCEISGTHQAEAVVLGTEKHPDKIVTVLKLSGAIKPL